MALRPRDLWLGLILGSTLLARSALAAEPTVITSATEDKMFSAHFTVDYAYASKTAGILRETPMGTMPGQPSNRVHDLIYKSSRHTMNVRGAFGFFHDIEVHVALPIIISDARHLEYDDTDATSSPTVTEGILPASGFDANNDVPSTSGKTVFIGPDRSGLDQIWLGARWAPLNQRRDPSKPTWTIGGEYRIEIGDTMKFNRTMAKANTGVGRGVNEFYLDTSISRRIGWADPFVTFWWLYPTANDGSNYPTFPLSIGQEDKQPQQRAGTRFGFESIVWEQPDQQRRIGIEVATRVEATFQGRGYSEMWEAFSTSPAFMINPDPGNTMPGTPGAMLQPHPGTTVIENYATFGGEMAIRGQLGKLIQFRVGGGFTYDQGHAITFDDAGKDRPNSTTDDMDSVVTPGTVEENPLHFRTIDLPGKRYRVDSATTWEIFVMGKILL